MFDRNGHRNARLDTAPRLSRLGGDGDRMGCRHENSAMNGRHNPSLDDYLVDTRLGRGGDMFGRSGRGRLGGSDVFSNRRASETTANNGFGGGLESQLGDSRRSGWGLSGRAGSDHRTSLGDRLGLNMGRGLGQGARLGARLGEHTNNRRGLRHHRLGDLGLSLEEQEYYMSGGLGLRHSSLGTRYTLNQFDRSPRNYHYQPPHVEDCLDDEMDMLHQQELLALGLGMGLCPENLYYDGPFLDGPMLGGCGGRGLH